MTKKHSRQKSLRDCEVRFGAVVLAGGLARRMDGQDKGLIKLAGMPMVQYALNTVTSVVDQCVVNANRNAESYAALAAPVGATVISDRLEGHLGPLAGLSAALEALNTEYVFMCPCDSPFLQAELVTKLFNACLSEDADIAVPDDGERLQPVFCVVNRRVKSSLDAFLGSGQRKIDLWFAEHSVCKVAASAFGESFRNINTEQELRAAEQEMME